MVKSSKSAKIVEDLVATLRADIRFGVYESGQRLKLSELQQTYGTSQFHVRQALTQLRSLELIEHHHNSGFRIGERNATEHKELRDLRIILERSAVPLVVARSTSEDVATLRERARAFESTVGLKDRQKQVATNLDFHQALYKVCGNSMLIDLIARMREQSHYAWIGRWRESPGILASAQDHFDMVDAIAERDPIELDRIISGHIRSF